MRVTSSIVKVVAMRCHTRLIALIFASLAVPANAGIVTISPPASVTKGSLTSDTDIFLFAEQSNLVLGSNLSVDISAAGLYAPFIPLSPNVISAGTLVSSFMLHADPASSGNNPTFGTVSFAQPILGIIISDAGLDATDAVLGNGGTVYPTGYAQRGLEFTPLAILTPDLLFLSGNMLNLSLLLNTSIRVDQIRVITAAIPEPSSLLLAALGGMGCVVALRRRRT